MRRADCAITLDTGTTHIAAAAGCPVLTIFTFNSLRSIRDVGNELGLSAVMFPVRESMFASDPRNVQRTFAKKV